MMYTHQSVYATFPQPAKQQKIFGPRSLAGLIEGPVIGPNKLFKTPIAAAINVPAAAPGTAPFFSLVQAKITKVSTPVAKTSTITACIAFDINGDRLQKSPNPHADF